MPHCGPCLLRTLRACSAEWQRSAKCRRRPSFPYSRRLYCPVHSDQLAASSSPTHPPTPTLPPQNIGVNFLSHFYLAHLLLDEIRDAVPSRIVFMTSAEEARGFVPWDDLT